MPSSTWITTTSRGSVVNGQQHAAHGRMQNPSSSTSRRPARFGELAHRRRNQGHDQLRQHDACGDQQARLSAACLVMALLASGSIAALAKVNRAAQAGEDEQPAIGRARLAGTARAVAGRRRLGSLAAPRRWWRRRSALEARDRQQGAERRQRQRGRQEEHRALGDVVAAGTHQRRARRALPIEAKRALRPSRGPSADWPATARLIATIAGPERAARKRVQHLPEVDEQRDRRHGEQQRAGGEREDAEDGDPALARARHRPARPPAPGSPWR